MRFNADLLWQLALVPVKREQGSLAWPPFRGALWLRAPRDPKLIDAHSPRLSHTLLSEHVDGTVTHTAASVLVITVLCLVH